MNRGRARAACARADEGKREVSIGRASIAPLEPTKNCRRLRTTTLIALLLRVADERLGASLPGCRPCTRARGEQHRASFRLRHFRGRGSQRATRVTGIQSERPHVQAACASALHRGRWCAVQPPTAQHRAVREPSHQRWRKRRVARRTGGGTPLASYVPRLGQTGSEMHHMRRVSRCAGGRAVALPSSSDLFLYARVRASPDSVCGSQTLLSRENLRACCGE